MTSSETSSRNCGECTVCCSGWLRAEIHGHYMGGGVACHFLKPEGCGIYESRPQVCHIRSFGKDFERFYQRAENLPGVRL